MDEPVEDSPRRRYRDEPVDALDAVAPEAVPDLDAVSEAVRTPDMLAPRIDRPSADVAVVPANSRIPGAARDGYHQLPTAPVITASQGPEEAPEPEWIEPQGPRPRAFVGAWALGLAIVALITAFFVGFLLPLGLVAVVIAIVALRRPVESRAVCIWAIVLGTLAVVYSAGWLLWALPQLPTG